MEKKTKTIETKETNNETRLDVLNLVGNSKEIIQGPEENECHSNYSLLKLAQVLACDLHFTKMTTPFSLLCFSVPFP